MPAPPLPARRILPALALALLLPAAAASAATGPDALPDTTHAALLATVDSLITAGKPAVALERIAPVVAAREASGDRDSPAYLRLVLGYVEAIGRGAGKADSISNARAYGAVPLAERLHGAVSLEAATARLDLARYVGRRLRLVNDALVLADSAVTLRRNLLGPNDLEVASALVLAGTYARQLGRLADAETATSEVLRIRTLHLPPDHRDIAVALNNRAIVRRSRGDYAGSYEDAKAATAILTRTLPPDHPNHISSVQTLAASAALADEPQEAIRQYERVLGLLQAVEKRDSSGMATNYGEMGLVQSGLHDDVAALESQRMAQRILQAMAAPDSIALRNVHMNQGECLRRLGRLDEARAAFLQADAIDRRARVPSTEGQEVINESMGLVERAMGRVDSALACFDRAIEMRRRRGALVDDPRLLFYRGTAWIAAGDSVRGRADLESTLALLGPRTGARGTAGAGARRMLGQLDAAQGDTTRAFRLALESLEIERRRALSVLRYMSERQALSYLDAPAASIDLVLSLATRLAPGDARIGMAWDAIQRSRSIVFDELAARAQAHRALVDPRIGALAAAHHAARQRVANLLYRPGAGLPDSVTQAQVTAAMREAEQLEVELAHSDSPHRGLYAPSVPALDSLCRTLPRDATLVGLVRWNDSPLFGSEVERRAVAMRYAAFVSTASGDAPVAIDLGPAGPIEDALLRWRRAVLDERTSIARERTLGSEVRRLAWDPIAARLGGASRVYLVAEGALNELAWYALPTGKGGRLLDLGVEFTLLSTERDLGTQVRPRAQDEPVLAVGGIAFDRGPSTTTPAASGSAEVLRGPTTGCVDPARLRFIALPASYAEAAELAARARAAAPSRPCTLLEGAAASEAAFRSATGGVSWIHVATHGFYVAPACRGKATLNPLLFSGIALAGANQRDTTSGADDDGILTANELAALDLSHVRTVVITGCNTGLGDHVAGEGVYGLRRSLEWAGASTVVLGLWPVDDRVAGRWSRAFYSACWDEGRTVSAATRLAMQRVRAELAASHRPDRPAEWGPFVAAGRE